MFDEEAARASLEDLGGTVTAHDGTPAPAILREGDVSRESDGQQVKIGTATLRIVRDSLPLVKQAEWEYQETPDDPVRWFVVRDWAVVGAGRFHSVVVVEK